MQVSLEMSPKSQRDTTCLINCVFSDTTHYIWPSRNATEFTLSPKLNRSLRADMEISQDVNTVAVLSGCSIIQHDERSSV